MAARMHITIQKSGTLFSVTLFNGNGAIRIRSIRNQGSLIQKPQQNDPMFPILDQQSVGGDKRSSPQRLLVL